MKRIHIINGPNLNLLGKREPEIYGAEGFETYLLQLIQEFPDVKIDYFQSNVEGELINAIQSAGINADGVILNPAGYTHTSVAIGDAIAAINIRVVIRMGRSLVRFASRIASRRFIPVFRS